MTNHDESTQRPGRGAIVLHAAILGVAVVVLIWLVASLPEHRRWYDWLGICAWIALVVLDLWALIKVLRKRWAPQGPTGYMDRDGDMWLVRESGNLALNRGPHSPSLPLAEVEQEFGPLTPIYG